MAARDVNQMFVEPFTALGLRKRSVLFTIDMDVPFTGTIGLNTATKHHEKGTATVHPIIGVRHEEIERMVLLHSPTRIGSLRPAGLATKPTVTEPLAYIVPKDRKRIWVVNWGAGRRDEVDDITELVCDHGIPWMRRHATLAAICADLEPRSTGQFSYEGRARAVANLLHNGAEAAARIMMDELARLGNRQDARAVQDRVFYSSLQRHLEAATPAG